MSHWYHAILCEQNHLRLRVAFLQRAQQGMANPVVPRNSTPTCFLLLLQIGQVSEVSLRSHAGSGVQPETTALAGMRGMSGKARKDGGVYASTFVPADAGMEPAAESGGSDEMAALRSEVTSLRSEVTALRSELRLMSDAIDLINAGITQSTVRTEGLDPTDDFTSEDLKANLEEEEDKSARLIQSTWRRNAVGQAESAEGVFVNDATSDDTEEFGADFEDVVLEDWMLKG